MTLLRKKMVNLIIGMHKKKLPLSISLCHVVNDTMVKDRMIPDLKAQMKYQLCVIQRNFLKRILARLINCIVELPVSTNINRLHRLYFDLR